jgi:hypothetical protein
MAIFWNVIACSLPCMFWHFIKNFYRHRKERRIIYRHIYWLRRQQVSLKRRYIPTRLHSILSQITAIFMVTAVNTSIITWFSKPLPVFMAYVRFRMVKLVRFSHQPTFSSGPENLGKKGWFLQSHVNEKVQNKKTPTVWYIAPQILCTKMFAGLPAAINNILPLEKD